MRQALGLDRPLHVQYLDWLMKVIHGDLGKSLISGRPVMKDLILQLPRTMELMASAILLAVVIGIPAGILAAVRRSRAEDRVVSNAWPPGALGAQFRHWHPVGFGLGRLFALVADIRIRAL